MKGGGATLKAPEVPLLLVLLLLGCPQDDPLDGDGDGFAHWEHAVDPALADCDDSDPEVTPSTERLVPGGAFVRGSEESTDTRPVRTVELSPFCIDRTEVRTDAFADFLQARHDAGEGEADALGRPLYDFDDDDDPFPPRIERTEEGYEVLGALHDHPITEVWHWSGVAYCEAAGKRLPTEAEWEKAARGAAPRDWPWGDEPADCDHANMALGTEFVDLQPCYLDTLPVGSFPEWTSPYGLLDVAGNVAEWVEDLYDPEYYGEAPETDPQGPEAEASENEELPWRVSRGGSHGSSAISTTTWYRYPEPGDATSNGVGFRCVRAL